MVLFLLQQLYEKKLNTKHANNIKHKHHKYILFYIAAKNPKNELYQTILPFAILETN